MQFVSNRSEEVLKESLKKVEHGSSFEDAVKNTVDELLNKLDPNDHVKRNQILAAGPEVALFVNKFTRETGMGPAFLMGTMHGR